VFVLEVDDTGPSAAFKLTAELVDPIVVPMQACKMVLALVVVTLRAEFTLLLVCVMMADFISTDTGDGLQYATKETGLSASAVVAVNVYVVSPDATVCVKTFV
jgi:hypothetical protein